MGDKGIVMKHPVWIKYTSKNEYKVGGGVYPPDPLPSPTNLIYATELEIFSRNRAQLSQFDKSGLLQHSRVRLAAAAGLWVVQEDGGCGAVVHEQRSV